MEFLIKNGAPRCVNEIKEEEREIYSVEYSYFDFRYLEFSIKVQTLSLIVFPFSIYIDVTIKILVSMSIG